jgi:lipoic acid synthetase
MLDKTHSISPGQFSRFSQKLEKLGVNTICHSGLCPNRPECFTKKQIAFLAMGDICSRNCRYCGVTQGKPLKLDSQEPKKIALAVKKLGLKYVVITSVTRDDLPDQGASHFKKIVQQIRAANPKVKIELLIPDFWGRIKWLKLVVKSKPDIINHNIECSQNRFRILRPKGDYQQSMSILKKIKEIDPSITTKSGFMVGLGESFQEIKKTLVDLKENLVEIVTIGQYLAPKANSLKVKKLYSKADFEKIRKLAQDLNCFQAVFVGPKVRSSYHAAEIANL